MGAPKGAPIEIEWRLLRTASSGGRREPHASAVRLRRTGTNRPRGGSNWLRRPIPEGSLHLCRTVACPRTRTWE
jgi:hypothetical protein